MAIGYMYEVRKSRSPHLTPKRHTQLHSTSTVADISSQLVRVLCVGVQYCLLRHFTYGSLNKAERFDTSC